VVVFEDESWTVQVMPVDEYFLCRSSWKSKGINERCQYICMRILLARYIVDVEVFEPLTMWIVAL